jgi:selenocysteine-specific elongation factor
MKSIIVGTAGHIDHGKTALVKALTGIDADRLQEEKRRGITIDLGFAHTELVDPSGERIQAAFVDVPGHERFVRNMLAGVGGIDLVLLVIAADESIKPQTREHFDILQLLGVQRGITVLTKADAVDAETLEVVRLEVEEFLRGTFLETPKAPIVAVSSLTGAGLGDLKRTIVAVAGQVPARDSNGLTRLPIDRVFTMKGFGTVVTGTLFSGTIQKEDEMEVFTGGRKVRVRGIQVHGRPAGVAVAGQRSALNVAGASTEDLARGMILAPPDTFSATRRLDVQLRLLSSAPRALKNGARVHFHCQTMETIAGVRLIDKSQVSPGETALARLLLPQPALLLPGDRFIVRQFSPVVTIGGGVVLDPLPAARLPRSSDSLAIFAEGNVEKSLKMRILRRGQMGISVQRLVAESGLTEAQIESVLAPSLRKGGIVRVGGSLIESGQLTGLMQLIRDTVSEFHTKNPLESGIAKERLREKVKSVPPIFDHSLQTLIEQKKIEVTGEFVRLLGRGVVMKDEEAESKKKIEAAFVAAGLKVPALPEVLAGLKIDKARAQKIVTLLLRDRVLIKISDDLVFHRSGLEQLRQQVAAQKIKSPKMDVALFKEMTGVSRKYAIPLLEYLDRERITKRVGDSRVIL